MKGPGKVDAAARHGAVVRSGLAALLVAQGVLAPRAGRAQDLQPRAFSPAPVGVNFVGLGYTYSYGNLLFDQALPITNGNARLHSLTGAYVRTIDFFGVSGKVDALVPFALRGKWKGDVNGVPDSTSRTGFGDPAFRLSVSFVGAPAAKLPQFARQKRGTVVGASLQVVVPLGEYSTEKLINLGSNRWVFKPRVGISQPLGRWTVEGHFTAWLFTDNPDLLGTTVSEDPLWALDGHFTRQFDNGMWAALDAGYIVGGRTTTDGVTAREDQQSARFGFTLAVPLARRHAVKASYFKGLYARLGSDFDNFVILYQYRWGGGL